MAIRTRYVLVVPRGDPVEYWSLFDTNQGRYHYDTAEDALDRAALLTPSARQKLPGFREMVVVTAACWEHGDCCATVFSPEYVEQYRVQHGA